VQLPQVAEPQFENNGGKPGLLFWHRSCSSFVTHVVREAMSDDLKILVIDEDPVRAAILKEGLSDAGHVRVEWINDTTNLLARIAALDPDVVLIDLENPNRDVLEQMFQVSREVKRPIAMFVDQSDSAMITASVDAGVSAYIVDGLKKERIKAVLDMTISRFNAFSRLQRELDEARNPFGRAQGHRPRQRHLDAPKGHRRRRGLCVAAP